MQFIDLVGNALRTFVRELELLAVPLLCAGCNRYDVELCSTCAQELRADVQVVGDDSVLIYAGGVFAGATRNIIARWKDHGRLGLCEQLDQAAFSMVIPMANRLIGDWLHRSGGPKFGYHNESLNRNHLKVVLVPLPSGASATRARGFEPAAVIAHGLARGLTQYTFHRAEGTGRHHNVPEHVHANHAPADSMLANYTFSANVEKVLKVSSAKVDQSQLTHKQRRANLRGRISVNRKALHALGSADLVILIDDVVTTGATFAECVKVLNRVTKLELRAFALLATPSAKPTAEKPSFVNKNEFQK